mgnify:CR=1 FL=1
MDMREKITEFGDRYMVPTWIERIPPSHGWQLRFGKSKFFADGTNDGSGSAASLKKAISELKTRIKSSNIPNALKSNARANKLNDLPVGISGPTASVIGNSDISQHHLQVSVPRYGKTPTTRKVYIGTDNTYTDERFEKALLKAIKIREDSVKAYELEHQRATRKAVASL